MNIFGGILHIHAQLIFRNKDIVYEIIQNSVRS